MEDSGLPSGISAAKTYRRARTEVEEPVVHSAHSSPPLTPKSRVRALLAKLDDESSDDEGPFSIEQFKKRMAGFPKPAEFAETEVDAVGDVDVEQVSQNAGSSSPMSLLGIPDVAERDPSSSPGRFSVAQSMLFELPAEFVEPVDAQATAFAKSTVAESTSSPESRDSQEIAPSVTKAFDLGAADESEASDDEVVLRHFTYRNDLLAMSESDDEAPGLTTAVSPPPTRATQALEETQQANSESEDDSVPAIPSSGTKPKLSKKERELMLRETQRMARSLELEPEVHVIKTATVDSFLQEFDAHAAESSDNQIPTSPRAPHDSPPTSPMGPPTLATPSKKTQPVTMPTLPVPRRLTSFVKSSKHDSDSDDLEIIPPTRANQVTTPMKRIAALAHIDLSKGKSLTGVGSQKNLFGLLEEKRRQQTIRDREARVNELKSKGITVVSKEENAKQIDEVETLLERERRMADDIRRKEAAERDEDDVEYDPLAADEEEDDEEELEISNMIEAAAAEGDDEEEEDDEDMEDPDAEEEDSAEDEAEEDSNEDEIDADSPADSSVASTVQVHESIIGTQAATQRRRNKIVDDEDSDVDMIADSQPSRYGLEDMFEDTQPVGRHAGLSPRTKMEALRDAEDAQILDTQVSNFEATQGPALDLREIREEYIRDTGDSFVAPTQLSQLTPPTQDPETQIDPTQLNAEFEATIPTEEVEQQPTKRQLKAKYDKKHSRARGVVDEEAVESDDEWAGIGGASDEEQDEDGYHLENLVDDDRKEDLAEARVQELFAEKERDRDSEMLNKIVDNVANGGWRKRRADGLLDDLSGSEDENDYAAEMQAREKRRKLKLLEEERLSDLANNTKASAFLDSIADQVQMKSIFSETSTTSTQSSGPRISTTSKTHIEVSVIREQLSFLAEEDEDTQALAAVDEAELELPRMRSKVTHRLSTRSSMTASKRSTDDGLLPWRSSSSRASSVRIEPESNFTKNVEILQSLSVNTLSTKNRAPVRGMQTITRKLGAPKKVKQVLNANQQHTKGLFGGGKWA